MAISNTLTAENMALWLPFLLANYYTANSTEPIKHLKLNNKTLLNCPASTHCIPLLEYIGVF